MTLATERDALTSWPAHIIEIDLDYVTSSTSATNTDGSGCYNTPATSGSFEPLTVGTKTRRWVTRTAPLYAGMNAIPIVEGVSISEEKLTLGETLGTFGEVTINLRDFEDDDIGEDPFGRNVTGMYLSRLIARNPYIQGREIRVWEGYLTSDYDLSNGEWRTYYCRGWGNYTKGMVTLKGVGPLQLVALNKARCPLVSSWKLDAAVVASDTTFTITPGFYEAGDPTSGYFRVNNEIVAYTRTDGTLSVTRAQFDTTAEDYDVDEKLQPAAVWTDAAINTILYDILVNYAGVDAALIPTTDWQDAVDTWLTTYTISPIISEPTEVVDLLNELAEQVGFAMWWSPVDSEIKFLPLRPPSSDTATEITDDDLLVEAKQMPDISKRVSRADIFIGLRSPVEDIDRDRSYRIRFVGKSVGAGENEHGSESLKKIRSRWFDDGDEALAARTSYTIANQLRDGEVAVEIQVSKRLSGIKVGELVSLTTDTIIDADGDAITRKYWVVSRSVVRMGHTYKYRLIPTIFTARYAFLADPAAASTYAAATDAERDPSCYLADTNGLMPNGDPGYSFA